MEHFRKRCWTFLARLKGAGLPLFGSVRPSGRQQSLSPLSAERGHRLYNAQTAHLGMRRDPWSGHTQHTCACFARSARAPGTRARELSKALLRANFERGEKQCRCPCGVGALWQPETFLRTAFGVSAPVGLAWQDGGWTRQNCNARWAPGNYGAGCPVHFPDTPHEGRSGAEGFPDG